QFRGTSPGDPFANATLDPRYADNRFDQALWQAMVAPGSSVRPWSVQDYTSSGVLSFKAKDVSAAVKTTYRSAATLTSRPVVSATGTDLLSMRTRDIASVLAHGPEVGQQVKAAIGAIGSNGKIVPSLSAAALVKVTSDRNIQTAFQETPEFIRAAAFHNVNNYRQLTAPSAAAHAAALSPD